MLHVDGDELGMTHGFFQQYFKGIRVFGGEVITHVDKTGRVMTPTQSLYHNIYVSIVPSINIDTALKIADQAHGTHAQYARPPTAELVIYPMTESVRVGAGDDATAYETKVSEYRLAYIISSVIEAREQTSHTVYVIDAITGAVLQHWEDLHTAATVGTGNSEYSGTVHINTNSLSSGYELRDLTRGTVSGTFGVGNVVTDLAHGTSGNGTVYKDADDIWGDGQNYVTGSSTASPNGETAAVDAAYGIQVTWDMYKNVVGRSGIDGAGKATYLRVHYSTTYDNAFWSDMCFCMTFGDGSSFKVLTSLDVTGHELSHGVTANNGHGGLVYSGESGGLNESNSDVMGTMAEFYGDGGGFAAHSTTIPSSGGNWTIGEQLRTPPLRYMYKPSKDGSSPDAWSSSIGNLDVHYSSGPGNREFYFLSQGASSNSASDYYSPYLPGGMTGIGNDHSARIHYRALTVYYVSTTNYTAARTAHINAATDLYGSASAENIAVQNSFAAINVGSAAPRADTGTMTEGARTVFNINGGLDTTYKGYKSGFEGSYSPTALTGGRTLAEFDDIGACSGPCGTLTNGVVVVSGFSSDPGAGWLSSVTANGVTKLNSAAAYSYSSGSATWSWGSVFGFSGSGSVITTENHH
jgi:Zn-dependent metalloprotease